MKMKILIHVHVSISTIYKLFLFFWQHQLSIPRHTPTTIKKLHHSIIVPKVRKNAISNDQDHFAQDVTYIHVCHVCMYSRSEQNEDSSYIETWLWCFYNFNSTAWTCIALWQLTARLSTGRMTSRHYIITRMDGRSTSVPFRCKFRCWMCTHQMNIEECRTQKDNETSVGSQLASKFGEHLLAGWLDVRYH